MPDWCSSAPGSSRLSLEPAILQRLRSAGELPTPLRTSLGIQLAPALVACSARLSVNGGEADTFAKLLFGYGLLQLLFMLRLMPRIFVSRSMLLSGAFRSAFPRWPPPVCISAGRETAFHHLAMPLFILAIWLSACCCCVQRCCWSAENCCSVSTGKHS